MVRTRRTSSRPIGTRAAGAVVALMVIATLAVGAGPASATPGDLSTQSLSATLTPTQLAQDLAGEGVTVSNVSYTGANVAAGRFQDSGSAPDLIVGFDGGVILSSGSIASVVGPNASDSITTVNEYPGDADLEGLLPAGQFTFDATVLSFDFVPDADAISFRYVFASDEYNEYVGVGYDDVFGFFINGQNCATIDDERVSVDTINGGNPFGTTDPGDGVVASNPDLYRNNDPNDPGPPTINTEMDGLTTVLTCSASVTPDVTNTMKLAIADVGDYQYDSNVFIEAGSLTTTPPGQADPPGAPTGVEADPGDASALVSWTEPADDGGAPIDGYQVTCVATGDDGDVHVATTGGGASSTTVSGLTNDVEYTCSVRAHNEAGYGPPSEPSGPFTPTGSGGGGPAITQEVDPAVRTVIDLPGSLGTSVRMIFPAQKHPGEPVTVMLSLFGTPGEEDATCDGNPCIGQGAEWSLSDPTAFKRIKVIFFEDPSLVDGLEIDGAPFYKDGVPQNACGYTTGGSGKLSLPCVFKRKVLKDGTWKVVLLTTGEDPKGRI
jgi:Fibronectin type III domain